VAEEKGVALSVEGPDHLPSYGDRELIQQAVVNLVDNAVKFSPPGSAVQLSAKGIQAGVEISVTDQGPGIPEADRERVTERFFRGETARHTPERSPTKPRAGARVDEDQLLAGIDQEARVGGIQHVRIFLQRFDDTIYRHLSLQPVRIE